jgi:hypothetical protein
MSSLRAIAVGIAKRIAAWLPGHRTELSHDATFLLPCAMSNGTIQVNTYNGDGYVVIAPFNHGERVMILPGTDEPTHASVVEAVGMIRCMVSHEPLPQNGDRMTIWVGRSSIEEDSPSIDANDVAYRLAQYYYDHRSQPSGVEA